MDKAIKKDYLVGVIILNYNTYEDTVKLIKSLENQSIWKEVYIVAVGFIRFLRALNKKCGYSYTSLTVTAINWQGR